MKMWKVYDNNNDNNNNNNDHGQRSNLDQKSSLEPSAQVSYKYKSKYHQWKSFESKFFSQPNK